MPDRKLILEQLERLAIVLDELMPGCAELVREAITVLKERELPTELKQKMWNALYAEEDEYEKKFVGKEEHLNWFTVYRPWLQKGFDIAINTIAVWEGR